MKFKIIKNIINSLKAKNSKFNYIINTNLSLLKNEHLDFLKNNNTKLIISCN
ncbi:hypothetical protein HOG21_00895 [bacterium]|nr:hypothetical protein [bacterium]